MGSAALVGLGADGCDVAVDNKPWGPDLLGGLDGRCVVQLFGTGDSGRAVAIDASCVSAERASLAVFWSIFRNASLGAREVA